MGVFGAGVAEYVIELLGGTAQQPRERAVGRLFAPLAQHVKYEEKRMLGGPVAAFRQIALDGIEEQRHRERPVRVGSADGLDRQAFELCELSEYLRGVHRWLRITQPSLADAWRGHKRGRQPRGKSPRKTRIPVELGAACRRGRAREDSSAQRVCKLLLGQLRAAGDAARLRSPVELRLGRPPAIAGARPRDLASAHGELSRVVATHGGAALAPAARTHMRPAFALVLISLAASFLARRPRTAAPVLALACVFRCASLMQRNRNGLPAAPDLAGPAAAAAFELAVLELVHHAAQCFSLSGRGSRHGCLRCLKIAPLRRTSEPRMSSRHARHCAIRMFLSFTSRSHFAMSAASSARSSSPEPPRTCMFSASSLSLTSGAARAPRMPAPISLTIAGGVPAGAKVAIQVATS